MRDWVPALKKCGERCGFVMTKAIGFWQRYRFFIYGVIGWALIIANYPFGWALPKYAEF